MLTHGKASSATTTRKQGKDPLESQRAAAGHAEARLEYDFKDFPWAKLVQGDDSGSMALPWQLVEIQLP